MTDNDLRILERLPHVIRRMAEISGSVEIALKIAREFAGEEICIPKLDNLYRELRDVEIRREYDGGKPVRELVRKYNLTERHIYNILNQQPEENKSFTLPLF